MSLPLNIIHFPPFRQAFKLGGQSVKVVTVVGKVVLVVALVVLTEISQNAPKIIR